MSKTIVPPADTTLLSQLVINGTVVHETFGKRTHLRQQVLVQNGVPKDYKPGTFEKYPDLTPEQQELFKARGLVPLIEIRYWLTWGNLLRVNEGEKAFDLPTGEAVLAFVNVTLRKYQPQELVHKSFSRKGLVPFQKLQEFLDSHKNTEQNREVIMQSLDAFVGQFL